jgi:hypothetical protein
VIVLNGNSTITLERAVDVYVEEGATASDNYDGNLTDNITIDSSEVNENVAGSYNVYYYVEDSSGNNDTEIRTINVVDTITPLITIYSPLENLTYITSTIDLEVSSDELGNWSYSLDSGLNNISFTPNTTISGLANGDYNLSVYIIDPSGNENSSVISFTVDVPAPISSSSSGGSCKTKWVCTEWSIWSVCENGIQTRNCTDWDDIAKCTMGLKLDAVKKLTETINCSVPESTESIQSEPRLEVVPPIEPEEQPNKGFFSKITGGVTGFATSKTGKATIITIAALSLLLGVVHFIRKRNVELLN